MAVKQLSFTLIEIMIAVSILAVGLVLVLRSFLTVVSTLDLAQNKIRATQFLEEKISQIKQKSIEEDGLEVSTEEGEALLGDKTAIWRLNVTPLEDEELEDCLNKVVLTVTWHEANKDRDETLVTYLENKK